MRFIILFRFISAAALALNSAACYAAATDSHQSTPSAAKTSDFDQITTMAKKLYAISRNESGFCANVTEQYFSQAMLKLIKHDCLKRNPNPDHTMLDNTGPAACEDEPKRSQGVPCYSDYRFSKPKITGNNATMRVDYNGDDSTFYTVLKLIKEPVGWRVDDIAIISKAPDYEDSRPSIKAEMEKLIREHSNTQK